MYDMCSNFRQGDVTIEFTFHETSMCKRIIPNKSGWKSGFYAANYSPCHDDECLERSPRFKSGRGWSRRVARLRIVFLHFAKEGQGIIGARSLPTVTTREERHFRRKTIPPVLLPAPSLYYLARVCLFSPPWKQHKTTCCTRNPMPLGFPLRSVLLEQWRVNHDIVGASIKGET